MPTKNGGGGGINTDKPSRLYLAGQEVQGWSENCQNRGQLRSCRRNKLEQEEKRGRLLWRSREVRNEMNRLSECSAEHQGQHSWPLCSVWCRTPSWTLLWVDFLFLCSCAWVNGKKMLLECLWSGCNCRLRLEIVFMWTHDGWCDWWTFGLKKMLPARWYNGNSWEFYGWLVFCWK